MKERPILFSAPMVRAILDGSKTQTRRIVKNDPGPYWNPVVGLYNPIVIDNGGYEAPGPEIFGASDEIQGRKCPYGKPSDRLWVRENFAFTDTHCPEFEGSVDYQADGECYAVQSQELFKVASLLDPWKGPWKPSIHMPRWASRILLAIVSVRVEQLHDISTEDICAEGLSTTMREFDAECDLHEQWRQLWESINGAENYDSNPWVWVIEFKRVLP